MLETHTTATSPARCKVHFILTTFITAIHILVRWDAGVFGLPFFSIWEGKKFYSLGYRKVI